MSTPKVLIADDSPLVLRMIEKMLSGAGCEVVAARDGLEAIEKAVAEDVQLVILDVMMPRMNGYQACRLLKTEPTTRHLPVVILTSKDQAGDRFWGLETGADYYITKDSDPHRIQELVRNILAGEAGRPAPGAGRPADPGRHPLPGQRPAGPQALRGHDPFGDRPGGPQPGAVRRDLHLRHGPGVPGGGLHRGGHGVRGGGRPGRGADAEPARGAPASSKTPRRRLLEAITARPGGRPFLRVQARLFAPATDSAAAARSPAWPRSPASRSSPTTGWPASWPWRARTWPA